MTHSGQDERLHFLSVMHCLERLETLTIADPIRAQERIAHVAESVGVGVGVVVVARRDGGYLLPRGQSSGAHHTTTTPDATHHPSITVITVVVIVRALSLQVRQLRRRAKAETAPAFPLRRDAPHVDARGGGRPSDRREAPSRGQQQRHQ